MRIRRQLRPFSSSRALGALAAGLAINACDNAVAIRQREPVEDARLVAFVSDSGTVAGSSIFVMHADGTHKTKLTSGNYWDDHPAWSPNASTIAFQTNRSPAGIWIVGADGSNLRPLIAAHDSLLVEEPEWSPDGRSIAYVAEVRTNEIDDNLVIMIANADGSNAHRLTANPRGEQWPSWSPNGGEIAFSAFPDSTGSHIFVISADGTGQRQLSSGNDTDPRWSPDGGEIALMNQTGTSYRPQIFVMNADGSNRHAVTTQGVYRAPAWSPDGQQLEYEGFEKMSNNLPLMRVYRVNQDGSDARAITSDGADAGYSNSWAPTWKPAP